MASSRCREEALEPDPLSTGEEAEVRVVVVVVDTPPSLNDAVGVEKLDGVVSFKEMRENGGRERVGGGVFLGKDIAVLFSRRVDVRKDAEGGSR